MFVVRVKSKPLPLRVILPVPTVGATLSATPPPIVNVPPLPGEVLNALLTTSAVANPVGLAAVRLIAPPPLWMFALIVNKRAALSGESVVRLTLPPVAVIKPLVVIAPVFVIDTLPLLFCAIPVIVKGLLVLLIEILPLLLLVAFRLLMVLALFSVMPPLAVAVKLGVLMIPVCVKLPAAVTLRLVETEEAPSVSAALLFSVT